MAVCQNIQVETIVPAGYFKGDEHPALATLDSDDFFPMVLVGCLAVVAGGFLEVDTHAALRISLIASRSILIICSPVASG
jgi:hypothetical protein